MLPEGVTLTVCCRQGNPVGSSYNYNSNEYWFEDFVGLRPLDPKAR